MYSVIACVKATYIFYYKKAENSIYRRKVSEKILCLYYLKLPRIAITSSFSCCVISLSSTYPTNEICPP